MSFRVLKNGATAGTVVEDAANTTLTDKVTTVLLSPVQFGNDKYVTLTNRAVSVITHGLLWGALGEAWGHSRAAKGSQALIPFLRG